MKRFEDISLYHSDRPDAYVYIARMIVRWVYYTKERYKLNDPGATVERPVWECSWSA